MPGLLVTLIIELGVAAQLRVLARKTFLDSRNVCWLLVFGKKSGGQVSVFLINAPVHPRRREGQLLFAAIRPTE